MGYVGLMGHFRACHFPFASFSFLFLPSLLIPDCWRASEHAWMGVCVAGMVGYMWRPFTSVGFQGCRRAEWEGRQEGLKGR